MQTLTTRTYIGEEDLIPIVDLLNACEAVDKLDEGISVEELRVEFDAPTMDPAHDVRLWQNAEGQLIGFGELHIPAEGEMADGYLWFKAHPDHRDGQLEDDIIAWGQERMREVGHERGKSARMRSSTRDTNQRLRTLFERNGFEVSRYFWRMGRSLQEPIPEPQFPEGYTLSYVHGEEDVEPWVQAFNHSFIDHYNHHDMILVERLHRMKSPHYTPEGDLTALAPDGSVAGFCWCIVSATDNERSGRSEGWIELLGTRRGHRKIGLGQALVLSGLHRLKAEGVDTALLGVDGDSPTGATRLYESVGFRKSITSVQYSKQL